MKKKKLSLLLILCFFSISKKLYSQQVDTLGIHTSCEMALPVCSEASIHESFSDTYTCLTALKPQYFGYMMTVPDFISLNAFGHTGNYSLYGPLSYPGVASCEQIAMGQANSVTGSLSGTSSISVPTAGFYILKVAPNNCLNIGDNYEVKINTSGGRMVCCYSKEDCMSETDCANCISSFSPTPGRYVFSAWVKGDATNMNTSYTNPKVIVSFIGNTATFNFTPSGNIIDGWQRIDGEVNVPASATDIVITFQCISGDCYFDDVRFIPFDGKMVSYVYDPINLKMVAELDERNYATIYEYNEEGKLVRVKKETERGIMTIRENRENIHKQ